MSKIIPACVVLFVHSWCRTVRQLYYRLWEQEPFQRWQTASPLLLLLKMQKWGSSTPANSLTEPLLSPWMSLWHKKGKKKSSWIVFCSTLLCRVHLTVKHKSSPRATFYQKCAVLLKNSFFFRRQSRFAVLPVVSCTVHRSQGCQQRAQWTANKWLQQLPISEIEP